MPPLAAYRVSVCIPTCNRPNLLRRALNSVASQTIRPYEVLVGDDGDDDADRVAEVVRQIRESSELNVTLLGYEGKRLGLGRNVDRLFSQATGDAILLLHDDDELTPEGIALLTSPLSDENIDAVFGKNEVIEATESVDIAKTNALNAYYHRTPDESGVIRNTCTSALLQQFPDSGFLVRTTAARTASYATAARYGNACGYAYNVALSQNSPGFFYFVDATTYRYHVTSESLSNSTSGDSAMMAFGLAGSCTENIAADERLRTWLRDRSSVAIRQASRLGRIRLAWRWYFGPHHRRRIPTSSGLKTFFILLWRSLAMRGKCGSPPQLPFEITNQAGDKDHEIAAHDAALQLPQLNANVRREASQSGQFSRLPPSAGRGWPH